MSWLVTGTETWNVVACVSTEERWAAVARELVEAQQIGELELFRIGVGGVGERGELAKRLLAEQQQVAATLLGTEGEPHELFERHDIMVAAIERFISSGGENLILDISCFPKRFFFPIVKLVTERAETARNIVAAYTHAAQYADARLSEDPEPVSSIPMFRGARSGSGSGTLVVAAGAQPLGLAQIVDSGDSYKEVKVLYPFPAPPPLGQRNWDFLRVLTKAGRFEQDDLLGIDTNDVSRIFDRLEQLGGDAPETLTLAPFGPKPVSLAMCLYALSLPAERRPDVIYTQPKSYNPLYTSGVAVRSERPWITGYALKWDGELLYTV